MQLVLLCVLVLSLLQPGLLQDGGTENISNGESTVQEQHAWLVGYEQHELPSTNCDCSQR